MSQSKPANILDQTKFKNLNSEPVTPSEVSHIPLLDRDIFTAVQTAQIRSEDLWKH